MTLWNKFLLFVGIWRCKCCGKLFDSRDTTYRFRQSPLCGGECLLITAIENAPTTAHIDALMRSLR